MRISNLTNPMRIDKMNRKKAAAKPHWEVIMSQARGSDFVAISIKEGIVLELVI